MNRRESLALVAGAVTSLAGCGGFAGSSSSSGSESAGAERTVGDGPSSGTATDPETLLVRADTDRRPLWLAGEGGGDGGRPTSRSDARRTESEVIDSRDRADRLSVDPVVDGSRVTSFLQATEFESETVLVETVRVEECFRLALCRVSWTATKVSTDYARRNRPWDEQCASGTYVFETRLVRIPDAVDAGGIRARSTSVGTGACHGGDGRSRATSEGGSGPSTPGDTGSEAPTQTNTTTEGDR